MASCGGSETRAPAAAAVVTSTLGFTMVLHVPWRVPCSECSNPDHSRFAAAVSVPQTLAKERMQH